jgi:hypothetical protein
MTQQERFAATEEISELSDEAVHRQMAVLPGFAAGSIEGEEEF